jgi:hypothetical protein
MAHPISSPSDSMIPTIKSSLLSEMITIPAEQRQALPSFSSSALLADLHLPRFPSLSLRTQAKSKYESACSDLESARLKNERSQASGDRHADRAAKAFEEAKVAVGEKKNAFLVHTEIANREKERFYRQDLPAFQDKLRESSDLFYVPVCHLSPLAHQARRLTTPFASFRSAMSEDLHLSSLSTLHALFTTSQTHTAAHHSTLSSLTESTLASLKTVNLESDINLYIEYNVPIGQWKEPDGWGWEPADGFYEEGTMNLEPGPKIILQNRLSFFSFPDLFSVLSMQ